MADHDTSFCAGWAAAIQRISDDAAVIAKDPAHFSIYLARLWWAPADPACLRCRGSGVVPVPPPVRSCVPIWGSERCPECDTRFNEKMPPHPHLNPPTIASTSEAKP